MEPITAAAIAGFVLHLGKKIVEKSFETATELFTKDGTNWLKSLFFRQDNTPKDILNDLQKDPTDEHSVNAVVNAIQRSLRDNPENETLLVGMMDTLEKHDGVHFSSTTTQTIGENGQGNIQIGGLNAGRDITNTIYKRNADEK